MPALISKCRLSKLGLSIIHLFDHDSRRTANGLRGQLRGVYLGHRRLIAFNGPLK
jgi:hypothetical protein